MAFSPGVPVAFVASGETFPDALAGAPAAAALGGPVLLVRRDALPTATVQELDRLDPQRIVVLGGESAVSAAVVDQLDQYASNPLQRRAGADRYGTGVAVSSFFATAPKVFLATGEAFPDVLAAGAAAGFQDSPVLLVRKDCIPSSVDLEISRLGPSQVVVLGGEAALGPGVLARQVC